MELGLYNSCFLDWDLEKTFRWMEKHKLHFAELHGGPRYPFIDWSEVAHGRTMDLLKSAEQHGIEIVDIMYGALNFLHPDDVVKEESVAYAKILLDAAHLIGAKSVSVFTGRDPNLNLEGNFQKLQATLPPLVEYAETKKVKLLFENCPMYHEWPPHYNIAISPYMWNLILEYFNSPYIGINLDPSHLVWQGIDYLSSIKSLGARLGLAQAKDTQVLPHIQRTHGVLSADFWRHRIAGFGDVDWGRFIPELMDNQYAEALFIEHEDPYYAGNIEAIERGVALTIQNLSPFLEGID